MSSMIDLETLRTKYKILIVDDDKNILSLIKDFLLFQNYQCFTAKSGRIAFHVLLEENPDLIITDIRMPGMTSVELIGNILKINPEIQSIFMSGFVSIEAIVQAIDYRPIAFIKKPFMIDTLYGYVEKAFIDKQRISTKVDREN